MKQVFARCCRVFFGLFLLTQADHVLSACQLSATTSASNALEIGGKYYIPVGGSANLQIRYHADNCSPMLFLAGAQLNYTSFVGERFCGTFGGMCAPDAGGLSVLTPALGTTSAQWQFLYSKSLNRGSWGFNFSAFDVVCNAVPGVGGTCGYSNLTNWPYKTVDIVEHAPVVAATPTVVSVVEGVSKPTYLASENLRIKARVTSATNPIQNVVFLAWADGNQPIGDLKPYPAGGAASDWSKMTIIGEQARAEASNDYVIRWSPSTKNVSGGKIRIQAWAYDDVPHLIGWAISEPVFITVNDPPYGKIVTPSGNKLTGTVGKPMNLATTALPYTTYAAEAGVDSIASVRFYLGSSQTSSCTGTDLGAAVPDNNNVYNYLWTPTSTHLTAGSNNNAIKAKITDRNGAEYCAQASAIIQNNTLPEIRTFDIQVFNSAGTRLADACKIRSEQCTNNYPVGTKFKLKTSWLDTDGVVTGIEFAGLGVNFCYNKPSTPGCTTVCATNSICETVYDWVPTSAATFDIKVVATDDAASGQTNTKTSNAYAIEVFDTDVDPVEWLPPKSANTAPDTELPGSGNVWFSSDDDYRLHWNPRGDGYSYKLQEVYSPGNGLPDVMTPDAIGADTTTWTANQKRSGAYHYKIVACNQYGSCGSFDEAATRTINVQLSAPNTPADFDQRAAILLEDPAQSTLKTSGSFGLSWPANTIGILPTHYFVDYKRDDGVSSWASIKTTSNMINEYARVLGTYQYQVRACRTFTGSVIEEKCSEPGSIIQVTVLPPVIESGVLDCAGSCISFDIRHIEAGASVEVAVTGKTGVSMVVPMTALKRITPVTTPLMELNQFQLALGQGTPLYAALFTSGITLKVINPNNASGSISLFGNRKAETVKLAGSSPVVGKDFQGHDVLYAAKDNKLIAMDPNTGHFLWDFTVDCGNQPDSRCAINGTPEVDPSNGFVYVGSNNNYVYAIDSQYASSRWRFKTGGDVRASVVQDESRTLYVGSMDENFYALKPADGAVRWTKKANSGIDQAPILTGDGWVYFSDNKGQVYWVNREELGGEVLVWDSIDDSALAEELREYAEQHGGADWEPGTANLLEFKRIGRLFRLVLHPELPMNRKHLSFWTYALLDGRSLTDIATVFLNSNTGRVTFPESMGNIEFIQALMERAFPCNDGSVVGCGLDVVLQNGEKQYTAGELLMMLENGSSRAEIVVLVSDSNQFANATSTWLTNVFNYLYDENFDWTSVPCDSYYCDSDSDGLPDWWEDAFLGTLDQNGNNDTDGDGQKNDQEWITGGHPCDNLCIHEEEIIAPDVVSVPGSSMYDASAQVAAVSGEFRVNESGAATYSIPIALPAGTAGVAPQLSLNYSSQGGNGFVGLGWSIAGTSAISRCRQTASQDDAAKPITMTTEDRFCLDGQRLLLASGSEGVYGATYRTEIDSFSRITYLNDRFVVEGKDGSTAIYGGSDTNNSKVIIGSQPLTWSLSRFTDSVGNAITFHYASAANGYHISEIRYAYDATVSGTTGDVVSVSGASHAKVSFVSESREDVIRGYIQGVLLSTTKRVSRVNVYNEGAVVRQYIVGYLPGGPSRLNSIKECAASELVCKQTTTFDWALPDIGHGAGRKTPAVVETQRDRWIDKFVPADINGDGYVDLAVIEGDDDSDSEGSDSDLELKYLMGSAQGFVSEKFAVGSTYVHFNTDAGEGGIGVDIKAIDYNGDGRQDIAYFDKRHGSWRVFIAQPSINDGKWRLANGWTSIPVTDGRAQFVDLNSDGLSDVIYRRDAAEMNKLWSFTGTHDELVVRYLVPDPSQQTSSSTYYHFGPETTLKRAALPSDLVSSDVLAIDAVKLKDAVADFNGDGRVDLVVVNKVKRLFDCNDLPTPSQVSQCFNAQDDDNGGDDGGSGDSQGTSSEIYEDSYELLTIDEQSSQLRSYGRIPRQLKYGYSPAGVSVSSDEDQKLQVVDINGDGLSDVVYTKEKGHWYFRLNNGLTLLPQENDLGLVHEKASLQFVDLNVDGRNDIVWYDENARMIYVRYMQSVDANGVAQFAEARPFVGTTGHPTFLDLNNDGLLDRLDLASGRSSSFTAYYAADLGNTLTGRPGSNTIVGINNGMGNVIDIDYENLSTSDHYARLELKQVKKQSSYNFDFNGQHFEGVNEYETLNIESFYAALNDQWQYPNSIGKQAPTLELFAPMKLVTRVESTAPRAGATAGAVKADARSAIEYFYGNAKIQAAGRGMLGFAHLKTVDKQSGVQTVTAYRQDFPYLGRPVATATLKPDGGLLSLAVNDWRLAEWTGYQVPAKPYKPYLYQSVEKQYDLGGVETTTVVSTNQAPDDWGNATSMTVRTEGDGEWFEKATVNEYGTTEDERRLGRLSKTTVTHSSSTSTTKTRSTAFTYYTSGSTKGLLKTETATSAESGTLTTTYGYDSFGNKNSVAQQGNAGKPGTSQPQTRTTTSTFASGRYSQSASNAAGHVVETVIARNALGQPTQIDNGNGVVVNIVYDAFGRKVFETNGLGGWTEIHFQFGGGDVCADAASTIYASFVRSADGSEGAVCFDALGREIKTAKRGFTGEWNATNKEFDSKGRVVFESMPAEINNSAPYWTSYKYDLLGRVVEVTSPDGISSTTEYDGFQRIITNRKGQVKTETYDAAGKLTEVSDALGGTITYTYDVFGNLKNATTTGPVVADGATSSITVSIGYDELGRKQTMDDPDKGHWEYDYNAFGELVVQRDAKGQRSEMQYDKLGRMTSRTDYVGSTAQSTTSWVFDTAARGSSGAAVLGALTSETHTNNYDGVNDTVTKVVSYDNFGRAVATTTTIDGKAYTERAAFDGIGRAYLRYDASGSSRGERTVYNDYGYVEHITDSAVINGEQKLYYSVLEMDARGQVISERLNNGLTTRYEYDAETNALKRIITGNGLMDDVQDMDMQYDELNNLLTRDDNRSGHSESFCYDELNRLTGSKVDGACSNGDITYDSFGNIMYKKGVGQYRYRDNGAGPHAVTFTSDTQAGNVAYNYDANGNMTGDGTGRSLSYTTFDKPFSIEKSTDRIRFRYGADRDRYKRVDTDGSATTTTTYVGNVEFIQRAGAFGVKRYVAGGKIIVDDTHDSAGKLTSWKTEYVLKDHLGNIYAITQQFMNVDGTGIQYMSFDPWGARRDTTTFVALPRTAWSVLNMQFTTRGFTGHEMLDAVGLIHMNGRVYDPKLARFMSADPFIQAASDTQSYNRYSYVRNNPMNAVDPSGYFFQPIFQALGDFAPVAAIVVAAVIIWACVGTCAPEVAGMLAGFFGGGIATGTMNGAVMGAISGAAFGAMHGWQPGGLFEGGALNWAAVGKVAAHGMVGGVMSVAQGGKFGHGFLAAGVTQAASLGGLMGEVHANMTFGDYLDNALRSAALGGTVSTLTGGKFGNGAVTAAFSRLLNDINCGKSLCYAKKPTREELDKHYMDGSGKPVYVDGREVDLSYFDKKEFPSYLDQGSMKANWLKLIGMYGPLALDQDPNIDAAKYGSITVIRTGENSVQILPDDYDFEWHGEFYDVTARNIITSYRGADLNTPQHKVFQIHFLNDTPIK